MQLFLRLKFDRVGRHFTMWTENKRSIAIIRNSVQIICPAKIRNFGVFGLVGHSSSPFMPKTIEAMLIAISTKRNTYSTVTKKAFHHRHVSSILRITYLSLEDFSKIILEIVIY